MSHERALHTVSSLKSHPAGSFLRCKQAIFRLSAPHREFVFLDIKSSENPYHQLRLQDLVEWHLWTNSTVAKARQSDKNLRVVIGSFYSQSAHHAELEKYREPAVAELLNSSFINVIVDRDEMPAFEHLHRSIAISYGYVVELFQLGLNGGNLPRIIVLDPKSLYPLQLVNERESVGIEISHERATQQKRIVAPMELPDSDKVIRFPGTKAESDQDITFKDYLAKFSENEAGVSDDQLDRFFLDYARALKNENQSTGVHLLPEPLQHVKTAACYLHLDRNSEAEESEHKALAIALLTRLARSAFYDHFGGGFLQAHTLNKTLLPLAEKRMVTCAYFLRIFCEAADATQDTLLTMVARQTAAFLSDLRTKSNTFPSSIVDLDNDDLFHFTWNKLALKRLLTEDEFLVIETLYGLQRRPNYGRRFLLERKDSWLSVLDQLFFDPEEAEQLLESAQQKMFAARNDATLVQDERVNPTTCAAVSLALLEAGEALQVPLYIDTARATMQSLTANFQRQGEQYLLSSEGIEPTILQTVDLIYSIEALLKLLEIEWDSRFYELCEDIGDYIWEAWTETDTNQFRKPQLTAFAGQMDFEAVPDFFPIFDCNPDRESETAVFIRAFRKLSGLTGRAEFQLMVVNQATLVRQSLGAKFPQYLEDLDESLQAGAVKTRTSAVILRGPEDKCQDWRNAIKRIAAKGPEIYLIPYNEDRILPRLPEFVPRLVAHERMTHVTAYLRTSKGQDEAFTDLEELRRFLSQPVD